MRHWLHALLVFAALVVAGAALGATDEESVLEALAKRYWAAEVEQDWGSVYDMLSETEKGMVARDRYRVIRKEEGPFHYVAAQVTELAVAGDVAWVHVKYEFKLPRYPYVAPQGNETWQVWKRTDRWYPVPVAQQDQWPNLPPRLRPEADERALATRSAGLWRAMAGQDWKSVYGYLPPHYRTEIPLEQFLRKRALNFYYSPRVEWAEVTRAGGRVRVVYMYKPADPAVTKLEPSEGSAIENWIKADGNWYLDVPVPARDPDEKVEKTN